MVLESKRRSRAALPLPPHLVCPLLDLHRARPQRVRGRQTRSRSPRPGAEPEPWPRLGTRAGTCREPGRCEGETPRARLRSRAALHHSEAPSRPSPFPPGGATSASRAASPGRPRPAGRHPFRTSPAPQAALSVCHGAARAEKRRTRRDEPRWGLAAGCGQPVSPIAWWTRHNK